MKNVKKFVLLLLCLVFLQKEGVNAITFNNEEDVFEFLASQRIFSMLDMFNIGIYGEKFYYPFDLDELKDRAIPKVIGPITNNLVGNFILLGKGYNITNRNLIDYIDIIKNPEKDHGFNIRVLNFDAFANSKLIEGIKEILPLLKREDGEDNRDNENKVMGIIMQKLPVLANAIPNLNASILTLKYDHPLQNDLKFGVMLDINMDFNLLLVHFSPILNFNYSIGTWVEHTPKTLSVELKDFSINNNFKSGLFFTQKFYEFDFLLPNILGKSICEESRIQNENINLSWKSQNEFYDTHNTMLFTEWNFNMSFNDDSIYSWFINNINLINIVKLTNYSFNFKNPYFEGSIHEKLGYLGKHNYTIVDNNFRFVFDKTINFGKHFSIAIPLGFNLNFNFYGSHNNMLKDIVGESFVDNSKAFEPFIGLNVGIFGKSLNFEYNRNGYRFRFISRF